MIHKVSGSGHILGCKSTYFLHCTHQLFSIFVIVNKFLNILTRIPGSPCMPLEPGNPGIPGAPYHNKIKHIINHIYNKR